MKKNTLVVLAIGLVAALSIVAYGYFNATGGKTGNSAPKIELSPGSYDFGTINYGDTVRYSFKMKNSGNETLDVKRVATSCGCTTAKASKTQLLPGEEADLEVVYVTDAMTGAHAEGHQERIIYVKTNDPITPQAEVMIYANVNPTK